MQITERIINREEITTNKKIRAAIFYINITAKLLLSTSFIIALVGFNIISTNVTLKILSTSLIWLVLIPKSYSTLRLLATIQEAKMLYR